MRAELPGTDETHGMGRRIQRGTVKWFSDAKGYGFIQADDGTDIFVHRSGIVGDGLRTLHEGQAVEYEQAQSGKGLLAVDVVPAGPGREAARR
jgi:CspA family cold shock protein